MAALNKRAAPWWVTAIVIVLSPVLLLYLAVALLCWVVAYICLHCAAWCWWNTRGVDVLLVYSNSPVWQSRIETELLPLIRERTIVLNWSGRGKWRLGLASSVFRFFGGQREFNPIAVVLRPLRRARVFRFWQPYRDWKHGHAGPLRQMEHDFLASIGVDRSQKAT